MTFDAQPHTLITMKGSAACIWCANLYAQRNHRPVTGCKECGVKLCTSTLTGRDCFKLHCKYGKPPKFEPAKQREKLSPKERKYWFNVIEADTNSSNKHSNAKKMKVIARKRAREDSADSEDSEDSD